MTSPLSNCQWPAINAKWLREHEQASKGGITLPKIDRVCYWCKRWLDNTVLFNGKHTCQECLGD
jgi:hypothetical protein